MRLNSDSGYNFSIFMPINSIVVSDVNKCKEIAKKIGYSYAPTSKKDMILQNINTKPYINWSLYLETII